MKLALAVVMKDDAEMLWSCLLTGGRHIRFAKAATRWSLKSPDEWDAAWLKQAAPMQRLVDTMGEWFEMEDWTLVFQTCDEALFLFFVLRSQAAIMRLRKLRDDELIPADMKVLWHKMMDVHPWDHWTRWTVDIKDQGPFYWSYVEPQLD